MKSHEGRARQPVAVARVSGVLVLRSTALGGRFVFVLFAAAAMSKSDFGRFGLLQGVAAIVSALVGLEAYQVFLRRIRLAPDAEAAVVRATYALLVATAAASAALIALVALILMGWSGVSLALGVAIVVGEYLGLEIFRNLTNEGLAERAVFSLAARSGIWGLILPALSVLGIATDWSLELVLAAWLIGLVVSVVAAHPLRVPFSTAVTTSSRRESLVVIGETLRAVPPWIATVLAGRMLEFGGRFIVAWQASEATAGRFALLTMVASVQYTVQKGVIEPIYFPRLLGGDESDSRAFARLTYALCVATSAVSVVAYAVLLASSGERPPVSELASFAVLLGGFGLLSLSQIPHFRLYRGHEDKAIRNASVFGAGVAVVFAVSLGYINSLVGVSVGISLGCIATLLAKDAAWRRSRAAIGAQ